MNHGTNAVAVNSPSVPNNYEPDVPGKLNVSDDSMVNQSDTYGSYNRSEAVHDESAQSPKTEPEDKPMPVPNGAGANSQ